MTFAKISTQECTDPCCNARTCQLADGAECAAGPCCQSNCRFRPYGTICRAASGQCDIKEYCSGDSSECPADTNLLDGTSCNSDTAYCYDGVCQTHDDQCRFHFGMLCFRMTCSIMISACASLIFYIVSVQVLVREWMAVTHSTIHEEMCMATVGTFLQHSFLVLKGMYISILICKDICTHTDVIYHSLPLVMSNVVNCTALLEHTSMLEMSL